MRKNLQKLLWTLGVSAMAFSCGNSSATEARGDSTTSAPITSTAIELPQIPSNLKTPEERARYLLFHYWDNFDFTDTAALNNPEKFEQAFSDYQSVFVAADSAVVAQSVRILIEKAYKGRALKRVDDVAEKYLYDPNSPMRNDDYYAHFLRALIDAPFVDEDHRATPRYRLECINMNRPGSLAADFMYETPDGGKHKLLQTPCLNQLLVVFYDPECENCERILSDMFKDERLNSRIKDNEVTVLAISTTDDRKAWKKSLSRFPATWTVGFDVTGVEDAELYHFTAMPTFYLLDASKHVLLKDPSVERLLQ